MNSGNAQVTEPPSTDLDLIRRAIELAEQGRGRVSPNPVVGAVLCASDGRVIGEGFHARFGDLHAERVAIADALSRGEDPRGGTLFVSLEPCCHEGKQPPCTEAIEAAGISRVVFAAGDPTGKASGSGPEALVSAGVQVDQAPEQEVRLAQLQNQGFRKRAATGMPLVTYKAAMTLDGKVAAPGGDSRWISGRSSRAMVHRLRAESDAVAVGVGTAIADDPLLTARSGDGSDRSVDGIDAEKGDQGLRVVFDRLARLPLDSALVTSLEIAPLAILVGPDAPASKVEELREVGAEVVSCQGDGNSEQALSGLSALAERFEVSDLLLEGGPTLAGALFDAGEIDRLLFFIAPTIIGSADAPSVLAGKGAGRIAEAVHPVSLDTSTVGEDVLLDARLKEW